MRTILTLAFSATLLFCGCASNKQQTKTKPILERPWIGGSFERVSTPASVRTNAQKFAGHGILITRVREETPLAKAGLQEGDLLLALNGKNVRLARDLHKIVDSASAGPLQATIYRAGEISEKSITPGLERYQKSHHIMIRIGFATKFDVDVYPDPDFSLIALGLDHELRRMNLGDAVAKYRTERGEYLRDDREGWRGLSSSEGWTTWLGPFAYSENKMIISQEPAR
jgi:membrane-associated protease RseP (regulator of RpoE activity)